MSSSINHHTKCPICKEVYWKTFPYCYCDVSVSTKDGKTSRTEVTK